MSTKFELTKGEINSPLWARLEEHLAEKLARKRGENDQRKSQADTDYLRGEIAQLKAILALGKKDVAAG